VSYTTLQIASVGAVFCTALVRSLTANLCHACDYSTVDVQVSRLVADGQGRLPDTELYSVTELFSVLNSSEIEVARTGDDDLVADVTGEQHPDQLGT
jgi:hypothetical protein